MKENFDDIDTDLLVKYVTGEASSKEGLVVMRWLETDASNRKYYDHLKLIWDQSRQLPFASPVSEDAAWQRFKSRIPRLPQPQQTKAVVRRFLWMRVAALFILAMGGTWLTLYLLDSGPERQLVVRSKETIFRDTLPDGSIVTLNRHSNIRYPTRFTGNTRTVSMAGEAFFTIAPDQAKPFVIHIAGLQVKVVGTSFNIKNSDALTEIIVETGIVEVTKNRQSIRLMPKEKLIVPPGHRSMSKQNVTDKLYRYYRSKKFVCESTPLYKLVETLNEAYDANITIERKELRMLPLTTVFDNEPLDNILAVISHTFSVKVTRTGNQIILN